jgi:peptide/nickel transport system ATP-binding protein
LLKLDAITKDFRTGLFGRTKKPVLNDVTMEINRGEIVGLIGESGCGKSTLARIVLKLLEPTSGNVILDGTNITQMSERKFRCMRSDIQLIFQNPAMSLDPQYTLYDSLIEALSKAGIPQAERKSHLSFMADALSLPLEILNRYPNQVSGGEVQRAVLARVLTLNPKYLVLDEPTSMLDVSVQAYILNFFKKIKTEQKIGMLFISHDLDVVKVMCDRIVVMKAGHIIEAGTTSNIFNSPKTAYTQFLIKQETGTNLICDDAIQEPSLLGIRQ